MKKSAAESKIREFACDWSDYDSQEHYTHQDVDDCYWDLLEKHPEFLKFGSGKDIHLDREELARAWIEQELHNNGQHRRLTRLSAV